MEMLNSTFLCLINAFERMGITDETRLQAEVLIEELLKMNMDDEFVRQNHMQYCYLFILVIEEYEESLTPNGRRSLKELKSRIIRCNLTENWRHGIIMSISQSNDQYASVYKIVGETRVYEDGTIQELEPLHQRPSDVTRENWVLNDIAQLCLNWDDEPKH